MQISGLEHDRDLELEVDALESELDAALRKVVSTLVVEKSPNEAAWWLCANHPSFLLNYEHTLLFPGKLSRLMEMASAAGSPPMGGSWNEWFERVRKLST